MNIPTAEIDPAIAEATAAVKTHQQALSQLNDSHEAEDETLAAQQSEAHSKANGESVTLELSRPEKASAEPTETVPKVET